MARIEIPKDCFVCDVCNAQLSDSNFVATAESVWYVGWLYCMDCKAKYTPEKFLKLVKEIHEGEDCSQTKLAKPIIMEDGF